MAGRDRRVKVYRGFAELLSQGVQLDGCGCVGPVIRNRRSRAEIQWEMGDDERAVCSSGLGKEKMCQIFQRVSYLAVVPAVVCVLEATYFAGHSDVRDGRGAVKRDICREGLVEEVVGKLSVSRVLFCHSK